jgi:hypothetical protein
MDVCMAARAISNCLILYSDNSKSDAIIDILTKIGGWCGYSTTSSDLLTVDLCDELRYGGWEIQSSLASLNSSVLMIRNGATMLLSDYAVNIRESAKIVIELRSNNTFDDFNYNGNTSNGILYLKEKQTITKNWNELIQFGGIDIEISYKGSLNMKINNCNYKEFTRNSLGVDDFSLRFSNKVPSFVVESTSDTEIHNIIVRIARF